MSSEIGNLQSEIRNQPVQPEPGQHGHAECEGKHPAEGRVQLAPAGHQVVQRRVEWRAEREEEGEDGQGREEGGVLGMGYWVLGDG